jgi:hypothetical protein
MVTRSIPLAFACLVLLGAACQPVAGSRAAAAPSPKPSSLAERAQKADKPMTQAIGGPTPRPAATPRAPEGPSLSAVYANSIQIDAQHLLAADGLRVSSCGGSNRTGCLSALQQVTRAANTLQGDLNAHPAPPCLQSADATMRSAISLYLQGAQLNAKGLNDGSSSEVTQGRSLLDQGTTRFRAASTQLGQSGCTVPPPAVAP